MSLGMGWFVNGDSRYRPMLHLMRAATGQAACWATWDKVFEQLWESYETCTHLFQQSADSTREACGKCECGVVLIKSGDRAR
jgi:hypothetical protein